MDNPFQPPSAENIHRPQPILDRIERTLLHVGLTLFLATGGTAIVCIVIQSKLAEGVAAVLLLSTIGTGLCRDFVRRVLIKPPKAPFPDERVTPKDQPNSRH